MEVIVAIDEVSEDEPLRVWAAERHAIGIYQSGDDYYAIDDWCPHAGGYMTQGPFEEGLAMCPIHGFQFDVKTGHCRQARTFDVASYPVTRRGDTLVIEVDEPDTSGSAGTP